MSRAQSTTLALSSGLLFSLAFPGPGLWPLALIAYAPLLLALEGVGVWRAAWLGWLTYALLNLFVLRFLWVPLHELGALSWISTCLALLLLAAIQGLQGLLLGGITALGSRIFPFPAAFLAAHLASEYVPRFFPWSFGALLFPIPALIQSASLGGAPLVSLWLATINVIFTTLLARKIQRPWPWRWAWAPAISVALASFWGHQRYVQQTAREEHEETWTIGLIHGVIPLKPDHAPEVEGWLDVLQAVHHLERQNPRLILLPETILPFPLRQDHLEHDLTAQWPVSPKVPVIAGTLVETPNGLTNSAILHSQAGIFTTSKKTLLPFGEYVPLGEWLPWLRHFSPKTIHMIVPPPEPLLSLEGPPLGISICYEGIQSERIREMVHPGGAQLLLNLTNDAWFPSTQEPQIHLTQTQIRAVEQGRYWVRSTNLGRSVVVAPSGRILVQATGSVTLPLLAQVAWRSDLTLFTRWGSLVSWGVLAGLLVILKRHPPWRLCQGQRTEYLLGKWKYFSRVFQYLKTRGGNGSVFHSIN